MIRSGGLALWLALIGLALFCIALAKEHTPQNDGLPLVHADYPLCVTVQPPAIHPRQKPVLYPRNSELS